MSQKTLVEQLKHIQEICESMAEISQKVVDEISAVVDEQTRTDPEEWAQFKQRALPALNGLMRELEAAKPPCPFSLLFLRRGAGDWSQPDLKPQDR